MFLADNGSNWFMSGAPDSGWDNTMLQGLGGIKGSDLEFVDESSLMVQSGSGQAQVPCLIPRPRRPSCQRLPPH